ncbi:MAG: class I SAM-dependent methyltransferase, partial [Actinomycetota bacterium]
MSHWFEPLADHMGEAYLRYSFTKGTRQEVDFLWDALQLVAGARVLDVGCGPGRHALELARRGAVVHGIDIAQRFVGIGQTAAATENLDVTFERGDA